MKILLTWLSLSFLSLALATPPSLKAVVLQGGGAIQAAGPAGFLVAELNTEPFSFTLTTDTASGDPLQDITLEASRTAFNALELTQVQTMLGTIVRQCLGGTPPELQALAVWLTENNAVTGLRRQTIGKLRMEFSRWMMLDTFESGITIHLTREGSSGSERCTHEWHARPGTI